jgi:ABC-2 type transport system permease protein
MLNLLKHEIQSRFGAILGWGIGLALFGSMYIALFPEMSEQLTGLGDLSIYQAMGIDMTSFAGYMSSVVIQYVPLLLGIYAIITSTKTLAGEEDSGTLELVLAMPLHRWQIVAMKALAISVVGILIVVVAGLGDALVLNLIKNSVDVDVTAGQFFAATLNAIPITLAFLMMGLFFGAYLPSRRAAALVMTVIFVSSYFGRLVFGMVESLEPFQRLSLFHYFDTSASVFTEGVEAGDVLLLLAVALIFFVLALLSFQRRDVTVGLWPWQRARMG